MEEIEEDLPVDIDFIQSSKEWKSTVFKTSIKQKKFYPWHSSRCGFIKENGEKCAKKSYFCKRYINTNTNIDVDECDSKIYCWFHKKYEQMDKINRKNNMEKHILKILQTQKEVNYTMNEYIKKLMLDMEG